jgi:hypothetical protein
MGDAHPALALTDRPQVEQVFGRHGCAMVEISPVFLTMKKVALVPNYTHRR